MALPTFNLPFQNTDMPQRQVTALDPGTQGLINDGVTRAGRPSSEFANEINAGVSENVGQLAQGAQQAKQQDQALGGVDQNMMGALRGAYASQAGDAIGRIKLQNQHKAELHKADYMNQLSQTAMAQQRVATQNYSMLTQAYNQSEMARAQVINSIFQTAGSGMAMAAGNRAGKGKKAGDIGGQAVGAGDYEISEIQSVDGQVDPYSGGTSRYASGHGERGGGF